MILKEADWMTNRWDKKEIPNPTILAGIFFAKSPGGEQSVTVDIKW